MLKKLLFFVALSTTACAMEYVNEFPVSTGTVEQSKEEFATLFRDLGAIFFDTSMMDYMSNVDIELKKSVQFPKVIFDFLEQLPLEAPEGFKLTSTKSDIPFPYAIYAYQEGRISGEEIKKMTEDIFVDNDGKRYFSSQFEEKIVRSAIQAIFTPKSRANSADAILKSIELLDELPAHHKEDYKKEFNLSAELTKWCADMQKRMATMEKLFSEEGTVFGDVINSGDLGIVQPNEAAHF